MATTKVIEIQRNKEVDEVLIALSRDEAGKDHIRISAWHLDNDGTMQIQQEHIYHENILLLQLIIDDFSEESAKTFIKDFTF